MKAEPGTARAVSRVIQSTRAVEGAGMVIRRSFPTAALEDIDPFLLLDHLGPVQLRPGEDTGFPDHPHRGFETVTYVLEGEMEHKDSQGNQGVLGPGHVQWMTAGSGLVHSEMPSAEIRKNGGRLHGFQLWVNLPRADKMTRPRYQELEAARIPAAQSAAGDVQVKVIAGEALGARAAIDTRTPIFYLHYMLQPGASVTQPVAPDFNVFAYVIEGQGAFGRDGQKAAEGQLVVFKKGGDSVAINATTPLSVLLIGGRPIGEPVARYGPFVMNTKLELAQAFEDYQSGRMGRIA